MKTAYIQLIKHALREGLTVSVWDGEEWQVKRSTSLRAIVEAVKSVEEAELRIRQKDGKVVTWAHVGAYDLAPDETVMDCGDNEWTNAWFDQYNASLTEVAQ